MRPMIYATDPERKDLIVFPVKYLLDDISLPTLDRQYLADIQRDGWAYFDICLFIDMTRLLYLENLQTCLIKNFLLISATSQDLNKFVNHIRKCQY